MKPLIPLLALCLTVSVHADDDKQALRELRALYEKAVSEGDPQSLKPHLADDFTAVMVTAEEVTGHDGVLAYWEKVVEFVGDGGSYRVSLDPDDSIIEGDIAITKGRALEQVTLKSGKSIEFTSLWTAVARKEEGTWKLVRIHAAIDPIGNPIIAYLNRAKGWLLGGGGLLLGLIAGLLIRRCPKRARTA